MSLVFFKFNSNALTAIIGAWHNCTLLFCLSYLLLVHKTVKCAYHPDTDADLLGSEVSKVSLQIRLYKHDLYDSAIATAMSIFSRILRLISKKVPIFAA